MNNYPKTDYTETFLEFVENNEGYLSSLIVDFEDDINEEIISTLISKYSFYEIGGETEDEFKLYFEDTYKSYYRYYKDKLNIYNVEINLEDTSKQTTTYEHTELPHGTLSSTEIKPNDRSKTITDTEGELVLNKQALLEQVRDYINEFCEKFKEDFILIYK